MQRGFVWLDEAVPGILWDAKYATSDNFTGAPVDGYAQNRLAGTVELAAALARAAALAEGEGLRLFLWGRLSPPAGRGSLSSPGAPRRRMAGRNKSTTRTSPRATSCRWATWRRAPATAAAARSI